MNKQLFLGAALLLFVVACTNDDVAQDRNTPDKKGNENLTAFVIEENNPVTKAAQTRTTGQYSGSGIDFYWTAGDPLWVNKAATGEPDLQQSTGSDIAEHLENSTITGGVKRATSASFYFDGTFTAQQYKVRYTGKNGTKDKVTIKNEQTQTVVNDASHIGESGDCGTAVAQRQSNNRYTFMLDHKAAYMVFLPFNTPGAISGAKLTQVKVTADNAIAGEFKFNDSGIDLDSRPASSTTNKSITLKLTGNFIVPKVADKGANAAIMVIAPGTYSTFTVEYKLYDSHTHVTGTITKTYTNVTLTAGKNKKVSMNLDIPIFGTDNYYMWDAVQGQHYWKGFESYQPTTNNGSDSHYPKNSSDQRWFNTKKLSSNQPSLAASRSCIAAPNINESLWYIMKGTPHWDNTYLWAMNGHLYINGMWFKKLSVIAKENGKPNATALKTDYNGKDWRSISYGVNMLDNKNIGRGKPANVGDYFFLPAMGYFFNGKLLDFRTAGLYWTSTADRYISSRAHNLYFTSSSAVLSNIRDRQTGCYLWKVQ